MKSGARPTPSEPAAKASRRLAAVATCRWRSLWHSAPLDTIWWGVLSQVVLAKAHASALSAVSGVGPYLEYRCAMNSQTSISGIRIALLATHGFEQSELEVPLKKLREAGATVDVVSLETGKITGWNKKDWGRAVNVDRSLDDASANDYAALVLPGGQMNPDLLRVENKAIQFVRNFAAQEKPIAAICHAPWLLIEADLVRDQAVTSYPSIRTDVINAGGKWRNEDVVVDGNLITSRNPDDLDAFCTKIIEIVAARAAKAVASERTSLGGGLAPDSATAPGS